MEMNGPLFAVCLVSLVAASLDYRNYQLVVVTPDSNASRKVLRELHHKGLDGMIFANGFERDAKEIHVIVNPEMKRILEREMREFGLNLKVLNVSVNNMVKKTLPTVSNVDGKREEEETYNYSQYEPLHKIFNELKRIADTFKRYASLIRLGKSSEGREMLALKISHEDSENRRAIFIQCGIHAREWISHATCMFLLKELLALCRKADGKQSTNIVKLYDWIILPVFNVDGYAYSQEKDRFWRKSRSKTKNPNCKGVDLNRNWPFHFNVSGWHSSSNPCSSVYRGSGPSSEIEVKNVLNYLNSIQSSLVAFYDLHSFGQNVLYPWAFTIEKAPDDTELAVVARNSSAAMENVHGRKYTTGTPSKLMYAVGGSSMDYVYAMLGIKYSFTIELRSNSSIVNFLLPPDQIKPQGDEVLAGILTTAENFKA